MTTTHESSRKVYHIHSISFNSDRSFFTVCMDEGARIYHTEPLQLYHALDFKQTGSVRVAEQLENSCIILMAFGGAHQVYSNNVARFYSCSAEEFGLEIVVPFKIVNILLREEKAVLVGEREIQIYDTNMFPRPNASRSVAYNTYQNSLGLCQMSRNHAVRHVLCFPATISGTVQIVSLTRRSNDQCVAKPLKAHQAAIQCLRLSSDGCILATASKTGTLIRLWNTNSQSRLMEFRRGIDTALLYDIDISPDNQFMACVSDKQTVHVFAVKNLALNCTSNLSGIGPKSSYTDSVWGMAQFSLHDTVPSMICIKTDGSVTVVTTDGRYLKYVFNKNSNSSPCQRLAYEIYSDLAPFSVVSCIDDESENSSQGKISRDDSSPVTELHAAIFGDGAEEKVHSDDGVESRDRRSVSAPPGHYNTSPPSTASVAPPLDGPRVSEFTEQLRKSIKNALVEEVSHCDISSCAKTGLDQSKTELSFNAHSFPTDACVSGDFYVSSPDSETSPVRGFVPSSSSTNSQRRVTSSAGNVSGFVGKQQNISLSSQNIADISSQHNSGNIAAGSATSAPCIYDVSLTSFDVQSSNPFKSMDNYPNWISKNGCTTTTDSITPKWNNIDRV